MLAALTRNAEGNSVGMLIGLLFLAFMIFLLVAILRFTIVSERRMRGAEGRLRRPNATAVAGIVGFAPPADLVPFFEQSPFVDRGEFQLVDRADGVDRAWDIGRFIPLTARDVREALAISSVKHAIPIAWDMDKGVYVVTPAGAGDARVAERARPAGPRGRERAGVRTLRA